VKTAVINKNGANIFRMKENLKKMSAMLTAVMIAVLASFTITSCDDDDPETDIIYTMGISKMSSSSTEVLSEMEAIYNAYKTAVNVDDNTFTMKGNASDCDKKVKEACEKAELSLKDKTWTGSYTFTVTNVNNKSIVYEHTFSNDDNFIF
ncbi:MAG: hypothetical protein ACI31A_09755, partial [Candidatus Limisoma sp.]